MLMYTFTLLFLCVQSAFAYPTGSVVNESSSAGMIIYMDSDGAIYRQAPGLNDVDYSTNGGQNWTTLFTPSGQPEQVRKFDSGRILITDGGGHIYVSDMSGHNFTLTKTMNGTSYNSYAFGLSVYDQNAIVGEYGMHTEPRRNVYMSEDEGLAWTTILTGNNNTNFHIHDVAYDPYENLIWVTTGDFTGNRMVWVSDANKINWYNTTDLAYGPFTTIIPLVDNVLFVSDNVNYSKVYRWDRPVDGTLLHKSDINNLTDAYTMNASWATLNAPFGTQAAIKYGSDSFAVFAAFGTVQNGASPQISSALYATKDGINFDVLWQGDHVPTTNSSDRGQPVGISGVWISKDDRIVASYIDNTTSWYGMLSIGTFPTPSVPYATNGLLFYTDGSRDYSTKLIDMSGNRCNGARRGGITWYRDPSGICYSTLDGINDFMYVSNTSKLNNNSTGTISFGTSVSLPDLTADKYIMSRYYGSYIIKTAASGNLKYGIHGGGTGFSYIGTQTLQTNTPYSIMVVYNGTHLQGYINGVPDGAGLAVTTNLDNYRSAWYIGSSLAEDSFTPINKVYTTYVYNRSLNSSEIQQNYVNDAIHWIPSAVFDINDSVTAPINTSFTGLNDVAGVTYTWNFGDGDTSNDINPTHAYTQIGLHPVNLTVQSVYGETLNVSVKSINVQSPFVVNSDSNDIIIDVYKYEPGYVVWNESSVTHSATTQHIIGDFPVSTPIQITRDGVNYALIDSNSTGYINWTYTGEYGEHEFEAFVKSDI